MNVGSRVPFLALVALVALVLTVASGCGDGSAEIRRVLFVTLDTTRADRLGFYGYESAETPALDAVAARSTVFEQAVSPVPTTLPSHSTMFTGLYPPEHGVRYNLVFNLGPEALTLAEMLSDRGFETAAFPATYILARRFGLGQGFDTYDEPVRDESFKGPDQMVERNAREGVDRALTWMQARPDERQFVWLHFYDPHLPYRVPFPYSDRFRDRPYDGEIAYMDAQLGRIFDWLEETGGWDDTLLVVVGDHGEGLFDHGVRGHAYLVYEATQRVPLLIRVPDGRPGRVDEPVGLADLTPTVLDLVGIPAPREFSGISLAPAVRGRSLPQRELYAETRAGTLNYGWQELKALRDGPFKLIASTSSAELYDLSQDPREQNDLAALEIGRVEAMQKRLDAWMATIDSDRTAAEPSNLGMTAEQERMLASLGYAIGVGGAAEGGGPHPRDVAFLSDELLLAQSITKNGQWAKVREFSEYVLGVDATNKWALANLSLAYAHEGRMQDAQDTAVRYLEAYPDNEQSHINFVKILKMKGDEETALTQASEARKLFPDSQWVAYYHVLAAFDTGQADVCRVTVPEAGERFATFPPMTVMRARCAARADDHVEAVRLLREAAEAGFAQLELVEKSEDFAATVESDAWREWRATADGKLTASR